METERIKYNGWQNCMRLSNKEVELIVTADVGPRIIRFAFVGERNVLGEIADQAGGTGDGEVVELEAPEASAEPFRHTRPRLPVRLHGSADRVRPGRSCDDPSACLA